VARNSENSRMTALACMLTFAVAALQSARLTAYSPVPPWQARQLAGMMTPTQQLYPREPWRQTCSRAVSRPGCSRSVSMSAEDDSEDPPEVSLPRTLGAVIIAGGLLIAQPVVWTSLYCVATTGAGLPAGPLGLLGALEGLSYLAILGVVGVSLVRKATTTTGSERLPPSGGRLGAAVIEGLSYLSLVAAILTLGGLIADQGCIPNAKPILDYSDYLPVCDARNTPGLFGGQ
jgi:hypothetical protein